MEPRKIGDQLVGHRGRHGIEGIRPIEREDFNGIALFDGDGREFVHDVAFPKGIIRRRDNRMSRGGVDGHNGPVIRVVRSLVVEALRKALAKQNTPYHNIVY